MAGVARLALQSILATLTRSGRREVSTRPLYPIYRRGVELGLWPRVTLRALRHALAGMRREGLVAVERVSLGRYGTLTLLRLEGELASLTTPLSLLVEEWELVRQVERGVMASG